MPAASGLAALATSPASWLKIDDLPMFVPPTIATTKSGGRSSCAKSLFRSRSNHSWPAGGGTPAAAASGSSAPIARSSRRTLGGEGLIVGRHSVQSLRC